jgi:hypothetical protein
VKWEKLGLIWKPPADLSWAQTHATLPIVHVAGANEWWVYIGCRDANGKTRVGRILLDTRELPHGRCTIARLDAKPVLSLGDPGAFDDCGVMPSWVVENGDELWMYTIGWNVSTTVPYRLSIGLATSRDNGSTFKRLSQGPIVDRNVNEPYFVTTPCVLRESEFWRMWYVSCTGWREIGGRLEPGYHIKYAESRDGLAWQTTGISCIDLGDDYAVARPCVFRNGSRYAMLYSYRSLLNYRSDTTSAYRLGYAESGDGIHWDRLHERAGIDRSESGWDSEMIEYCWLQPHRGEHYLLYNGNGFGQSGFGIARLVAWD